MNIFRSSVLVAAVAAASTVSAHDEVFVDPAADGWTGGIGAGLVKTSGNTETENGSAYVDLTRLAGEWTHRLNVAGLYTADSERTTAEKYFISFQTNRALSEKSYVFGFASYDDDRFGSFEYQATAAVGYGRQLIANDKMNLSVEAGPGYRVSKPFNFALVANSTEIYVDPITNRKTKLGTESENEVIARFAEMFDWQFSSSAKLLQQLNVETGSDNTVSRLMLALETSVIGNIALRVSYNLKYTDNVSAGTDHADTETAVSLAYSF